MNFDAATVDEQPVRGIVLTCQRTEDLFPNSALSPAHEPIVERLLRAINIARAVSPPPAALQGMDNPAQHSAIVNPIHATHVGRQKWLNPSPLRIRKPKEISHLIASLPGAMNHNPGVKGIPLMGPDPSSSTDPADRFET